MSPVEGQGNPLASLSAGTGVNGTGELEEAKAPDSDTPPAEPVTWGSVSEELQNLHTLATGSGQSLAHVADRLNAVRDKFENPPNIELERLGQPPAAGLAEQHQRGAELLKETVQVASEATTAATSLPTGLRENVLAGAGRVAWSVAKIMGLGFVAAVSPPFAVAFGVLEGLWKGVSVSMTSGLKMAQKAGQGTLGYARTLGSELQAHHASALRAENGTPPSETKKKSELLTNAGLDRYITDLQSCVSASSLNWYEKQSLKTELRDCRRPEKLPDQPAEAAELASVLRTVDAIKTAWVAKKSGDGPQEARVFDAASQAGQLLRRGVVRGPDRPPLSNEDLYDALLRLKNSVKASALDEGTKRHLLMRLQSSSDEFRPEMQPSPSTSFFHDAASEAGITQALELATEIGRLALGKDAGLIDALPTCGEMVLRGFLKGGVVAAHLVSTPVWAVWGAAVYGLYEVPKAVGQTLLGRITKEVLDVRDASSRRVAGQVARAGLANSARSLQGRIAPLLRGLSEPENAGSPPLSDAVNQPPPRLPTQATASGQTVPLDEVIAGAS